MLASFGVGFVVDGPSDVRRRVAAGRAALEIHRISGINFGWGFKRHFLRANCKTIEQ